MPGAIPHSPPLPLHSTAADRVVMSSCLHREELKAILGSQVELAKNLGNTGALSDIDEVTHRVPVGLCNYGVTPYIPVHIQILK